VVIITHRMSTLAVADSILVLHEGTVKLHGPRDQVLAAMRSGNQAGADVREEARPASDGGCRFAGDTRSAPEGEAGDVDQPV
jgi:ABC-type glutathione transport system ATPase component